MVLYAKATECSIYLLGISVTTSGTDSNFRVTWAASNNSLPRTPCVGSLGLSYISRQCTNSYFLLHPSRITQGELFPPYGFSIVPINIQFLGISLLSTSPKHCDDFDKIR